MKKIIYLIILIMLIIPINAKADDDISLILEQELSLYDFSQWQNSENINAGELIRNFLDGSDDYSKVKDNLVGIIKGIFAEKLPLIILLTVSGIACGVFSCFIPDDRGSLKSIISFIGVAVCIGMVTGLICDTVNTSVQLLDKISSFSEGATPVLALMLTATGRCNQTAVFTPLMTFLAVGMVKTVKAVIFPLICAGFAVAIATGLNEKSSLSEIFGLIKSCLKWLTGILSTVFIGIMTVSGIGAKARDGLVLKTAKYAIDKTIPYAGGLISGTADTILECFGAVKTAAGAAFIVIIVLIALKTLFGIMCSELALRISSAFIETVGEKQIPRFMKNIADMMKYLFATVLVCDVMFVVTVAMFTVIA